MSDIEIYLRKELDEVSRQMTEDEIIKVILYLREEYAYLDEEGAVSNTYLDRLDEIICTEEEFKRRLHGVSKKDRSRKLKDWREQQQTIVKYGLGSGPRPAELDKVLVVLMNPSIKKMNRRLLGSPEDCKVKGISMSTLTIIAVLVQYLLYRHGYVQMTDLEKLAKKYKTEYKIPSVRSHLSLVLKTLAQWEYIKQKGTKGKRWVLNE